MKRLLTLLSAIAVSAVAINAQILRTVCEQGEIEGELHNGYALYKAIPYAEKPVGDLRWHAPVRKAAWQGVYKAENWGDRPMQITDPNQSGNALPMSEDCLYLSVSTPAKDASERLPVFVNIHGGAFFTGSYSGTQDSFVNNGIVYCSIAYRLGAFGFMAHPEAAKESEHGIAGNYGLMDQIMALQWIHDNISRFGGDPDNVTICGESAGGISVSILCASPLCKGLFRRAICESGGNLLPIRTSAVSVCGSAQDATYARSIGLEFQKALGCKNLKQMRRLPAEAILAKTQFDKYWPSVDGYVITGDTYEAYLKGDYNDVDLIVGYNSDEGSLFVHGAGLDAYNRMIELNFPDDREGFMKAYPATNDSEALQAQRDVFRDVAFGWPSWAWATLQTRTGKHPVYFYYFDQLSENTLMRGTRGATHVAEMPFIYGFSFGGQMTETDIHMAQIMERYWINFIKTGNPNATALPYWPVFSEKTPSVMYMHEGFSLGTAPNIAQNEFLERYFAKIRQSSK